MDHRTTSDPLQDARHHPLDPASHPLGVGGVHDGSQAETQPMHHVQVPLDGAPRQPSLLPERGNQAEQVDPQALLDQHHSVQRRRWQAAALALGAGASDVSVFGYLHQRRGQLDLPSTLGPTLGQPDPTVGTLLHHMLHPLGGRHADAGEAVATGLPWLLGLVRLLVALGLQTGHPAQPTDWRGLPTGRSASPGVQ